MTFTALAPGNHVHVVTVAGTHYDATVSTNDGILTSFLLDDEPTTATILLDSVRDVTITPAPCTCQPHPIFGHQDGCRYVGMGATR